MTLPRSIAALRRFRFVVATFGLSAVVAGFTLLSVFERSGHAEIQQTPPAQGIEKEFLDKFPQLPPIDTVRIGEVDVPIFPLNPDPNATFQNAGPWSYPAPVRLVKTSTPFYDATTRTISLAFEQPPAPAIIEQLKDAKNRIAAFYKLREPTNTNINADLVTLQPIPLCGYEVSVKIDDKAILLSKRDPSDTVVTWVGKHPFTSRPIADDETKQRLAAAKPEDVTVVFRGYYAMKGVEITRVEINVVQQAIASVRESLQGVPSDYNIVSLVTRNGKSQVKQAVLNSINIVISRVAGADPEVVANLVNMASDAIDKYLTPLKPMTLSEINDSNNSFIIWPTETARVELRPAEFKTLTKSLETKESFQQTWDQAFDYLSTFISDTTEYSQFYKKLHDSLKSGQSASGSFLGILSAGVNVNLQNDFDSLSSEEKLSIQKLFDQLKTHTADKGSLMKSAYRNFNGEDFASSTQPKPLEVCHVGAPQFQNQIRSAATDIRTKGAVNVARDIESSLSSAREGWEDGYMRIERMLNETNTTLATRVQELAALIEEAKRYNYRIEWRVVERRVDREGDLAVDFGREVIEAAAFLKGFHVTYTRNDNHRIDHNVDTIRVQIGTPQTQGTRVTVHCWNYMHDDNAFNGDHASVGEISVWVIARVK